MNNSPQCQLVTDWVQGFKTKDVVILEKFLHKDYRHVTYPRSLKMPEQTKEEWLSYMKKIFPHWEDYDQTYHFIADVPGKVITHMEFAKKNTDIADTFAVLHIVTDHDGSLKIIKTDMFMDSKAYVDGMAKIGNL